MNDQSKYSKRSSIKSGIIHNKKSLVVGLRSTSVFSSLWKKELTPQEILFNRMPGWIGDHLIQLELQKKGLRYYKEALEKNPFDTSLLYKRSNAYGKCFEMQKGLADLQKIARIEPMNIKATARRLTFLFYNGEFEKCMMSSYNHMKIRKQPPYFALGLLTAKNAIEDCVGKRAGHPLRDYYEIIRDQAWQENAMKERSLPKKRKRKRKTKAIVSEPQVMGSVKPLKPVKPLKLVFDEDEEEEEEDIEIEERKINTSARSSMSKKEYMRGKKTGFSEKITKNTNISRLQSKKKTSMRASVDSKAESTTSLTNISLENSIAGSLTEKFSKVAVPKMYGYPYHPLQKRTTNIENYLACSYLGELFNEKRFLDNISRNPGYMGKNENGNRSMEDLTKEGLSVLEGLQSILHTRKPFYNIKYQEFLNRSRKVEFDKMILMEKMKQDAIQKLNFFFASIAKYVRRMDIRRMNKMAENMYKFCKSTNKAILPGRNRILCRLFKLLGDGVLFSYRFLPGMTEQQMITRVNLALGLPIERRISQESFYRKFKWRGLNWLDMINTFEQRVKVCKYSEEIIWLYHELSKFNLELKRYTLAKTYCGRCIHEARKCEDFKWAVNGYMMMTRVAVCQKNKNDVRRNIRLAISTAKNIGIKELDKFLQTCLGVINEWKFEKAKVDEIFQMREERIIEIIQPYEKKREATLLFDLMRSKPPDRRLPIIPGFVDTDVYDLIERRKEERRRKKKPESKLRGIEAENLIYGYIGRTNDHGMNI